MQTVATIFPIEPLQPQDLLFSVVSVPLPVPTGPNDPAPPHTLPGDSSFNEETLASALGYVAQVLSLTAAYMGNSLVYPVVCLGSRSVIKDPISAMMGPRVYVFHYSKTLFLKLPPGFHFILGAWIRTASSMGSSY